AFVSYDLERARAVEDSVRRAGGQTGGRAETAVQVLSAETDRLERLAREFSEFGRLPEGPQSEIDLVELLDELGRTGVPEGVRVTVDANGGPSGLLGHYEPLRRAFANLYRNAAEAMKGRGAIDVTVTGDGAGLAVTIADHGPGIPAEVRQRVFEPYFTTKDDGTGLGLALVRVTVEAHRGTISVGETPGGGATFAIVFPPGPNPQSPAPSP
ncbi:MAG: sensor histidine kinase, partial [Gemmatimonadales bacterium]